MLFQDLTDHLRYLKSLRRPTERAVDVLAENLFNKSIVDSIEKIVFEQDVPELFASMQDAGQVTVEHVARTVRMPARLVWIEYQTLGLDSAGKAMRVGTLLEESLTGSGEVKTLSFACVQGGTPKLMFGASFDRLPFPTSMLKFMRHKFSVEDDFPEGGVHQIVGDSLFALFLLQHKRVFESRDHTPSEKLQRARQKSGKSPLVPHRKVYINIGTVSRRAASPVDRAVAEELGEGAKRRYHQVLGHFRNVARGEGAEPRVEWIAPYYRGDPALGVITMAREVKVNSQGEES